MAKTSQEIEKEFIEGLSDSTGTGLKGWLEKIKNSSFDKRNDMIKWLKEDHGFGHMNASLLMGIYANGGKAVYASAQSLLDNQFEKYPEMRPLFEALQQNVLKWDKEVNFIAKKTYISLAKKREFAAVNVRKGELRLGMDMGDAPYEKGLEKSKLTGPMPRISHMIVLRTVSDIDETLTSFLQHANKRVNT